MESVKIKALFKDLDVEIKGNKELEINGLCADSRIIVPGNLFLAKKGKNSDGSQFIATAKYGGASAILTDLFDPFLDLTQIIHPNPIEIEAIIAKRMYDYAPKKLERIGVTGTKGKTSTTYLIKHFLEHMGMPCGLMGTVETIIGTHRFPSKLTTHDCITNHKMLKEMVSVGCKAVAMEVSSHGLDQGRVEGISFNIAVFTNLYPDHLDYHSDLQSYIDAKKKLMDKSDKIIVNADSFWGKEKGFSYGIDRGELKPEKIALFSHGTEFVVQNQPFFSPLIGKFNVYNTLAAISVALQYGVTLKNLSEILPLFTGIPGRLERIGNVFIDFAHTGEALESVLEALREIAKGKIIVVFGCGGNRDPQRRANMGRAAKNGADIVIVTSDNPRQEDPAEIARQIVQSFEKPPIVELDRKKAIELAISMAEENDLVLIAGKGHEQTQICGSTIMPFSDIQTVKQVLQKSNKFCHSNT